MMKRKKRRKYSREFKIEAVRLVKEEGYSFREAAESLGIAESMLRRWKEKLEMEGEESFVGPGRRKPADEELWRLREENKRLRMERDILKKATAFFANESQ